MSVTVTETPRGRIRLERMVKLTVRRVLFPLLVLAPFAYFFPKIALVFAICGTYDVSRNRPFTLELLRRYWIGNGVGTWLLSPINSLLDLLSLPYINKGVYQLADLPPGHREEIQRLIQAANDAELFKKVLLDDPLPPSARTSNDVHASVDEVAMKALARDPAARYQSAADFREIAARSNRPPQSATRPASSYARRRESGPELRPASACRSSSPQY